MNGTCLLYSTDHDECSNMTAISFYDDIITVRKAFNVIRCLYT